MLLPLFVLITHLPHILIIALLELLRLGERIKRVIVVPLSHEGLSQCDLHIDLQQPGSRQLVYQFLVFVQGQLDVFYGLLQTFVSEVGFA